MTTKTQDRRSPERAERRLVYMSTKQLAELRRLSKREGSSQQALIRAGIDLLLVAHNKGSK